MLVQSFLYKDFSFSRAVKILEKAVDRLVRVCLLYTKELAPKRNWLGDRASLIEYDCANIWYSTKERQHF